MTTWLKRIGVDAGGTFTDCVFLDGETRELRVAKVPSQPRKPQAAIVAGIDEVRASDSIESVTHGTTIATNAVITGDLASVGLITTRGFRDSLEIGTQQRPSLYDLRQQPHPVLIPRYLRYEVGGRLSATGEEIEPIDTEEVEDVARELAAHRVEAIAVAGLFSYTNPAQELQIRDIVERLLPLYVGCSGQISNEPREYPRFVTAAVNAALSPRIDPYVLSLQGDVAGRLDGARLYIMHSNGGVGTVPRSVRDRVHRLILSGPAAGVIGGSRASRECGYGDCVTFDVGGTSADVGVVRDGAPRTAFEMELPNGIPCKLPHIEVETIGAGGGSIGWVDAGGGLNVGPQSAGAEPGPACYGRGGSEPTVTDAHLVLGRLSPEGLIGGELKLDPSLAFAALARLGGQIGTGADGAALGVLALIEENMAGAIRRAAARHGDDLREFVLVAGGGAGPLHAASLMRKLHMRAAVVPLFPGLLRALGLLSAPIRHDAAKPFVANAAELSDGEIAGILETLTQQAMAELTEDGVDPPSQRCEQSLELRYVGQQHTLAVPTTQDGAVAEVVARFHELHHRTFGHSAPDVATEVVAARVVGLGLRTMPETHLTLPEELGAPDRHREVLFEQMDGRVRTPIYQRHCLARGQRITGPAVIEQLDTTTVLPSGVTATVHDVGALIITDDSDEVIA